MSELHQKLLLEPTRSQVIHACVQLIETHVAERRGLKGTALRTGLGLLKAVRDDAVSLGVARLLPDFAAAIEPHHREFLRAGGGDFSRFLAQRSGAVSESLVAAADARVAASGNAGVRTAYRALRRFAHEEVSIALPQVGELLGRFVA